MGGELSKSDIAKREAAQLRNKFLRESFKTPSMKRLGIDTFNILILGEVGSGKSSAINTFVTAMHDDEDVYYPALSLGVQDGHVTTGYKLYILPEKSGIRVFDTWGIYLNENYLGDALSRMLDGTMSDGEKDTSSISETQEADERPPTYSKVRGNTAGREIHMVVFCASADSNWAQPDEIVQADYEQLPKIATMMKEIYEKKGICSAVLMTKSDTVTKRVFECESAEEIQGLPEVAIRLHKVSRATGVPKSIVIPMISQTSEFKRSPIVDVNAIHVLKMLMKIAEGHLDQTVARMQMGIK